MSPVRIWTLLPISNLLLLWVASEKTAHRESLCLNTQNRLNQLLVTKTLAEVVAPASVVPQARLAQRKAARDRLTLMVLQPFITIPSKEQPISRGFSLCEAFAGVFHV